MRGAIDLARRIASADGELRGYLRTALWHWDRRLAGECPSCGYAGRFRPEPHLAMAESCPKCGSLERQRLLALAIGRGFVSFAGTDVLHFAPDPAIARLIDAQAPDCQVSADLAPGRAEAVLNIEALDLPDGSFDRIVCSHVLEHVDDGQALRELHRVLRPGGQAVVMTPVAEGWSQTYEDLSVVSGEERLRHFAQEDHVRYYGADVRARIAAAGFGLREFVADGADCARHRLMRGERVFLATKP